VPLLCGENKCDLKKRTRVLVEAKDEDEDKDGDVALVDRGEGEDKPPGNSIRPDVRRADE